MKILAVNGSPHGEHGNTEVLVRAFVEGAREAGAECETVYLKDKKIEHCIGCLGCWVKTPGVCILNDDMPELLLAFEKADVLVCATPLYVFTVTGLMKDFMDRSIPLAQPFVDIKDGVCSHPMRYASDMPQSAVLISNCGFPETEHFEGLNETWRRWSRAASRATAGSICCAGGAVLQNPDMQGMIKWYVDATRQAGREVVEQGQIADQTQATLDRPLVSDQAIYVSRLNSYFESMGVKRI